MVSGITLVNKTKGKQWRLPFVQIKRSVLGQRYELDVIFVTPSEARQLNKTYRKKNKPANVLSFPLSKTQGQIILCPREARHQAPSYKQTSRHFIGFLFIHGLLHLKGYRHGSRMEVEEKRLSARFLRS
jgi:probable rRNA maturation factor